jgi:hypothetical protein
MSDNARDDQTAQNTDPPGVRCSWCGGRVRWESGGYWLTCPVSGHPSRHDPRIKGPIWRLRVLLGV